MPHPEPRFTPPPPDRTERAFSALAGLLFLVSWAVAYVIVAPPEPHHALHAVAAWVRL